TAPPAAAARRVRAPGAGLRPRRTAPEAGRDGGRSPSRTRRRQLRARPRRRRSGPSHRPRRARARRRVAGRARPGVRARIATARECPLAADAAALPLGQPAPDAELLAVAQGVLEALGAHLAASADRLRLLGGGTALREEQVRVDPQAVGLLLPATLGRTAVCRRRTGHQALCSDDLSHRPSPSGLSTRTARPPNDADVITTMPL